MKIIKKETLINAFLAALGGFILISCLSFLDNSIDNMIWLIPPFGASMVLVMSAHESPLAHPKNVIFGHILSSLSGLITLLLLGDSFYSIGAGVGLAIFIMIVTNTVHPPAGANPIIVIMGSKDLSFIIFTVAIGAIVIVIFALIYNKLLGRIYPLNRG